MKRAFAEFLVETGRLPRTALAKIARGEWASGDPLGRLALQHNLLSGADIDRILQQQNLEGGYFGEIAQRLELLTRSQLDVLLVGQGVRGCVELVEHLALLKLMDISTGLTAIAEFAAQGSFQAHLEPETARAC